MSGFDPVQLERESQMAKKKAGEFNKAAAVRDIVQKLGKDVSVSDVADALTKAHPGNKDVAALVENKNMLANYRSQAVKKLFGDGKKTAKKKAGRGGPDGGGIRKRGGDGVGNGILSDVAVFALKHGGIEEAKAALDQLAEEIGL